MGKEVDYSRISPSTLVNATKISAETTAEIKNNGPSLPTNITKQMRRRPSEESSEVIPRERPHVA